MVVSSNMLWMNLCSEVPVEDFINLAEGHIYTLSGMVVDSWMIWVISLDPNANHLVSLIWIYCLM